MWRYLVGLGVLVAIFVVVFQSQTATGYDDRPEVSLYVDQLVSEHSFDAEKLRNWFSEAERKQSILDAISRPAERALRWDEYRAIFLKEKRILQGVEFWQQNQEQLLAAENIYGVPPEIVVAIIGVETRYGRNAGGYRVIDALMTLGFDYPPRADFFRNELTEFLLLAREEGKNPLELKGSYAGAMGFGQFIPSSFRAYAVDFDEDGVRDIWANTDDAIGSVANYFHQHRWQGNSQTVVKVQLTDPADDKLANELANKNLEPEYTTAELEAVGVDVSNLPVDVKGALFRMDLEEGSEYWVGLHDFYVITRYNHSRMYALAVYQLAEAIKEKQSSEGPAQ